MRVFTTTDAPPTSATERDHIYNGLDCCVTFEVLEVIEKQFDQTTRPVYNFELALQAPVFEMELRGVRIDRLARDDLVRKLMRDRAAVQESFDAILSEGVGIDPISPSSPPQLQHLLYDVLGLPIQRNWRTHTVTTDRKALEKLRTHFYAAPIINHILTLRDLSKKISVLYTGVDPDGRMRTSFNIAGTDTGRFSSYQSASGSGTNLQNITPELRRIFIADPGMRLAYIDLEQAESRAVGAIEWNLFHDGRYLDACESGDLHTFVARMCWDHLPWTGDRGTDKGIAKQSFYRHFDYRDAAKRLGHASNYFGKPPHIAREVHIEQPLVAAFQERYFTAFPAHPRWHTWVRDRLSIDGFLTTFMGRRRRFFGRRNAEETVRAAIAYEPQSVVGDYLNRGMLEVWRSGLCQLLLQVHDAILIQYPEEREAEIVPKVQKLLEIEIPLRHGRTLTIPTEALVGWNWAYARNAQGQIVNNEGLEPYSGRDERKRSSPSSILDRRVPRPDRGNAVPVYLP